MLRIKIDKRGGKYARGEGSTRVRKYYDAEYIYIFRIGVKATFSCYPLPNLMTRRQFFLHFYFEDKTERMQNHVMGNKARKKRNNFTVTLGLMTTHMVVFPLVLFRNIFLASLTVTILSSCFCLVIIMVRSSYYIAHVTLCMLHPFRYYMCALYAEIANKLATQFTATFFLRIYFCILKRNPVMCMFFTVVPTILLWLTSLIPMFVVED